MFVLSLCKQLCPDKVPVEPGERLGEGADGEVFTIKGDDSKVLKLGILYERPDRGMTQYYKQIQRVLDYMMHTQPSLYVRVSEHGYLGTYSRQIHVRPRKRAKQDFIIYYYIMEKLFPITDDEEKVFHSIISHEDRGIKKDYSTEKIREMLSGMSQGLDFDTEKVILFYDNIKGADAQHLDLHPRNIMKDSSGNFRCVDLDRVTLHRKEK